MIGICHIMSGDLWAGAEAMAYTLLKGLLQYRDLRLSAILLNEGKLAAKVRSLGIPVAVLDEARESFPRILAEARRTLQREAPHIIHSHRYKENIIACLASGFGGRIRRVATQHGMPEVHDRRDTLSRRLALRLDFFVLSRFFRKTIAVSGDMRKMLVASCGVPEDRVQVIHNGIEVPEGHPPRGEGDTLVVGSAGRFHRVKDFPLLVRVAREVARRRRDVRFEIAGEGPGEKEIQELIRGYGLEGTVVLRGFVEETAAFYRGLDLYLNTSLHEGIPLGVLEAMSHGVPVVAPAVGGLAEIIRDGVHGHLVVGRDAEQFAEKCIALCSSPPVRRRMGAAARARVLGSFSLGSMAGQYRQLYIEALAEGCGGSSAAA